MLEIGFGHKIPKLNFVFHWKFWVISDHFESFQIIWSHIRSFGVISDHLESFKSWGNAQRPFLGGLGHDYELIWIGVVQCDISHASSSCLSSRQSVEGYDGLLSLLRKSQHQLSIRGFFVNTVHNWVKVFVEILKSLLKGQLMSKCLQIYQN